MSIKLSFVLAFLVITACAPIMRVHGYVPNQADLDSLAVGADTKSSVEDILGHPSDTGVLDSDAWYYVESTVKSFLYYEPEVVERRVLVLDFDENDVLRDIAEFGLEDGRVVNLQSRVTPIDGRRTSVLNRLFRNVGAVTPPLPGN